MGGGFRFRAFGLRVSIVLVAEFISPKNIHFQLLSS